MTYAVLVPINLLLIGIFVWLLRQEGLLGYPKAGKWYLTWMSIGVITLMDELTSVYYAPAEAHRFIGGQAIFFIAFTSLLMRFLSSRMVEIAQILEANDIRGGGVYSFSYLVLGPAVSFVAVASIMVDYILTACISAVSAVVNGTAFLPMGPTAAMAIGLTIIWGVAGLNILGIRENARVTFWIFIAAAFVFVNLIALGFLSLDANAVHHMYVTSHSVVRTIQHHSWEQGISVITVGVASCVLAYSGIESVVQTAGLVESWKEIKKAYWFLALTVGLVTPLISAMALSSPIDFSQHEGDLITHWATMVANVPFGVLVGIFGSVILIMAVNTAYVASSELLERVAHRYHFEWLTVPNARASLYRIHIINGLLYTAIILVTAGSQGLLAEMYAIGLLASFVINIGCLMIYRWSKGTKEIPEYHTSRVGTLLLWLVLTACFAYLAVHKPYGTGLWAGVVTLLLAAGIPFSRRYGPEVKQRRQSDYPLEMMLELGECDMPLHVWFRRPGEHEVATRDAGSVFVTFFDTRGAIPAKLAPNHYRFPIQGGTVTRSIAALLALIDEELGGRQVTAHFGWPTSSWLDRMSTGVFVANLLRLPKLFPRIDFAIEHPGQLAPASS